jgi:hypothetical protein
MRIRALAAGLICSISSIALGQAVVSVDWLDPSDGGAFTGMPANIRIVDVYVDVADSDVWTGGGIRAIAEGGATLAYFDSDPTTPGTQPGLYNGGAANKFYTSLSKPRPRDGGGRFGNAGIELAGAYDPQGPSPTTTPNELNVRYAASPPESNDSPSVDGYVARIAIDVSGVAGFPSDFSMARVTTIDNIPQFATVVLRCVPLSAPFGTGVSTFDDPNAAGISWAISFCPEPTSAALLVFGGLAIVRRRES